MDSLSGNILVLHANATGSREEQQIVEIAKLASANPNVQAIAVSQELPAGYSAKFDALIASLEETHINAEGLGRFLRALKPNGIVRISCTSTSDAGIDFSGQLTLCGVVGVQEQNGWFSGSSPQYEVGTAQPLRKKKTSNNVGAKTWKLSADGNGNDDFVDEDDLLDDDFKVSKPDASSCGLENAATKRACKNCTCGLAEIQAASGKVELVADDGGVVDTAGGPKSSCGNCYKGDGFRCATCPYRGLPPFEPGQKVTIPDVIDADI
eukprot:Rmarinus@m.24839